MEKKVKNSQVGCFTFFFSFGNGITDKIWRSCCEPEAI